MEEAPSRQAALEVRHRVMGDQWVDSVPPSAGLTAFTDQAIEHLWGGAWLDDTLELRIKSLCTMTSLMALGHLAELRPHLAGALRNGFFTPAELRAIVLHISPYIGYPTGRHAMVLVDEIVEQAAAEG